MQKNPCIMQMWAEPRKSALPIRNNSQILYQFLMFTQNLGPVDKLLFPGVFLYIFICNRIERLVNSAIHIAFTSLLRFNAVADKRHSSVAF